MRLASIRPFADTTTEPGWHLKIKNQGRVVFKTYKQIVNSRDTTQAIDGRNPL
jgi:hypothetical protein